MGYSVTQTFADLRKTAVRVIRKNRSNDNLKALRISCSNIKIHDCDSATISLRNEVLFLTVKSYDNLN